MGACHMRILMVLYDHDNLIWGPSSFIPTVIPRYSKGLFTESYERKPV